MLQYSQGDQVPSVERYVDHVQFWMFLIDPPNFFAVLPVFWTICKTPTTFAVQTISDYRRGPGVLESPPIIGHADNQKNDFGYNLGGLEVFNKGDEFFELQLKPTIYITIPYHYIY